MSEVAVFYYEGFKKSGLFKALRSGTPLTLIVHTPPALAAKFPGPVDSFAVPKGPRG